MTYTPTAWVESGMSTTTKVNALNNLETQAASGNSYIDAYYHDSNYYTITLANSTFFKSPTNPAGRSDTGHGCGIDANKIDGYSLDQLQALAIPSGCIALWAKSVASIPTARWLHCNGLNSTPDFRGRILVGAGGSYAVGSVGGGGNTTPSTPSFSPTEVALTTNQIPKHIHGYTDRQNFDENVTTGATSGDKYPQTDKNISTLGINGIPNAACSTHGHAGSTLTYTGYYDDGSVYHAGSLPIIPKSKAYAYILRR